MQDWRKGRTGQALTHLAQAVALDPVFLEAQADLGVVCASTGMLSQALDHFEKALVLEPGLHVLYENKAGVLMLLDRPEEAEQAARQALRLAADSIDANYSLGMSLIMRGQLTPEALACLKLAASKDARAQKALASIEEYIRQMGDR